MKKNSSKLFLFVLGLFIFSNVNLVNANEVSTLVGPVSVTVVETEVKADVIRLYVKSGEILTVDKSLANDLNLESVSTSESDSSDIAKLNAFHAVVKYGSDNHQVVELSNVEKFHLEKMENLVDEANDSFEDSFKDFDSFDSESSSYDKGWDSSFRISNVSESTAVSLFNSLHSHWRGSSQCFRRAHFWSYSLSNRGYNTGKVFMFFTKKYINEYNYHWWFHVSPYILVNGVQKTLDKTFTSGPLDMKSWSDEFMHNKVVCPEISSYSQYENNQYSGYCYLRKVPMYYYMPVDLESRDKKGEKQPSWSSWTISNMTRGKLW